MVCLKSDSNQVGEVIKCGWNKCHDIHEIGEECEEDSLEENQVLVGWYKKKKEKQKKKN